MKPAVPAVLWKLGADVLSIYIAGTACFNLKIPNRAIVLILCCIDLV